MNTEELRWPMNAEVFAEWLQRRGWRVLRTASSYWFEGGMHVFQAFPYHWLIEPAEEELTGLLREHRALSLRYSTSLAAPVGKVSYHVVREEPNYGLQDLGGSARNDVRSGLKNCSVEPISFHRLADDGWELNVDTHARQGRQLLETEKTWHRTCLATADLPGFEAWGALVDGRLASYIITGQIDEWCYILCQQSARQYLRLRVNNTLLFSVTEAMLARPGIHAIFYGLHSLDAPASVDDFKFRMGASAKPVRQRVAFHPSVAPLVNRASHRAARRLVEWKPDHPTLAKAEGMIRFYMEGDLAIHQQSLPEVLSNLVESEGASR